MTVFSFAIHWYNKDMIRVALLEHENETKEVVFALSKIFDGMDWTFRHFYKASLLAKSCQSVEFQLFVFDEMFKTSRFESVFVHDHPNAMILYLCQDPKEVQKEDQRVRILYISKDNIQKDLQDAQDLLKTQTQQADLYSIDYDGVHVSMPYEDIYYLEKIDKMVYFHTKKGIFHKRVNMSDLEEIFEKYGFIRVHVSYIVNEKHITSWFNDAVELNDTQRIPMSRSQKRKIKAKRKNEE